METQIFHHAKIYQYSKNTSKEIKILQDIITLLVYEPILQAK
jgi:hypothetical protein